MILKKDIMHINSLEDYGIIPWHSIIFILEQTVLWSWCTHMMISVSHNMTGGTFPDVLVFIICDQF